MWSLYHVLHSTNSRRRVPFELVPLHRRLQCNVTLFLSLHSRLENKGMVGVQRIKGKKIKKERKEMRSSEKENCRIGFEIPLS